jgi:hypothetical protein
MSFVSPALFPGSRRARSILNELVSERQISLDDVNNLAALLDPFHDEPLPSPTWPDGQNTPSLPRTEQRIVNVSRGALADGLWDCYLIFVPCLNANNMAAYDYGSVGLAPTLRPSNSEILRPGWNVLKHAAGSWSLSSPGIVSEDDLSIPASFSASRRLVGAGIECVNTTSPLTQSGNITMWRSATNRTDVQLISGASDYRSYQWTTGMPFSLAEIGTMRTTVNHHAKYGLMMAATPDGVDQPVEDPTGKVLVYGSSNGARLGGPIYLGIPLTTSTATWAQRNAKFNFCGAYFAGLSSDTTLSFTVRYQLEDFPQTYENNIALVRPPIPYNPIMYEIMSRVIDKMPVGCKQNENPLGEWFNQIMDTVAAIAPHLSGVPYVGAFAAPIGAAAKAIGDVNRRAIEHEKAPVPPKRVAPPPVPPRPAAKKSANIAHVTIRPPLGRRVK